MNARHSSTAGGALAIWHSHLSSSLAHVQHWMQGCVLALGQALGLQIKMRKTGLSQAYPLAIHGVAVVNQNAGPSLDKLLERGFRALGVDHEQCGAGMSRAERECTG